MTTNVVINNNQPQPQPPTPTLVAVHSNQWSTGICDCFDDLGICCFAYWCFPCFACKTASDFGECFCLPLVDMLWNLFQMSGIPIFIPPMSMSMRVAVRNRYGIQTLSVISAQAPEFRGAQQYMVATQPAVITSQPMISAAPQGVLAARVM